MPNFREQITQLVNDQNPQNTKIDGLSERNFEDGKKGRIEGGAFQSKAFVLGRLAKELLTNNVLTTSRKLALATSSIHELKEYKEKLEKQNIGTDTYLENRKLAELKRVEIAVDGFKKIIDSNSGNVPTLSATEIPTKERADDQTSKIKKALENLKEILAKMQDIPAPKAPAVSVDIIKNRTLPNVPEEIETSFNNLKKEIKKCSDWEQARDLIHDFMYGKNSFGGDNTGSHYLNRALFVNIKFLAIKTLQKFYNRDVRDGFATLTPDIFFNSKYEHELKKYTLSIKNTGLKIDEQGNIYWDENDENPQKLAEIMQNKTHGWLHILLNQVIGSEERLRGQSEEKVEAPSPEFTVSEPGLKSLQLRQMNETADRYFKVLEREMSSMARTASNVDWLIDEYTSSRDNSILAFDRGYFENVKNLAIMKFQELLNEATDPFLIDLIKKKIKNAGLKIDEVNKIYWDQNDEDLQKLAEISAQGTYGYLHRLLNQVIDNEKTSQEKQLTTPKPAVNPSNYRANMDMTYKYENSTFTPDTNPVPAQAATPAPTAVAVAAAPTPAPAATQTAPTPAAGPTPSTPPAPTAAPASFQNIEYDHNRIEAILKNSKHANLKAQEIFEEFYHLLNPNINSAEQIDKNKAAILVFMNNNLVNPKHKKTVKSLGRRVEGLGLKFNGSDEYYFEDQTSTPAPAGIITSPTAGSQSQQASTNPTAPNPKHLQGSPEGDFTELCTKGIRDIAQVHAFFRRHPSLKNTSFYKMWMSFGGQLNPATIKVLNEQLDRELGKYSPKQATASTASVSGPLVPSASLILSPVNNFILETSDMDEDQLNLRITASQKTVEKQEDIIKRLSSDRSFGAEFSDTLLCLHEVFEAETIKEKIEKYSVLINKIEDNIKSNGGKKNNAEKLNAKSFARKIKIFAELDIKTLIDHVKSISDSEKSQQTSPTPNASPVNGNEGPEDVRDTLNSLANRANLTSSDLSLVLMQRGLEGEDKVSNDDLKTKIYSSYESLNQIKQDFSLIKKPASQVYAPGKTSDKSKVTPIKLTDNPAYKEWEAAQKAIENLEKKIDEAVKLLPAPETAAEKSKKALAKFNESYIAIRDKIESVKKGENLENKVELKQKIDSAISTKTKIKAEDQDQSFEFRLSNLNKWSENLKESIEEQEREPSPVEKAVANVKKFATGFKDIANGAKMSFLFKPLGLDNLVPSTPESASSNSLITSVKILDKLIDKLKDVAQKSDIQKDWLERGLALAGALDLYIQKNSGMLEEIKTIKEVTDVDAKLKLLSSGMGPNTLNSLTSALNSKAMADRLEKLKLLKENKDLGWNNVKKMFKGAMSWKTWLPEKDETVGGDTIDTETTPEKKKNHWGKVMVLVCVAAIAATSMYYFKKNGNEEAPDEKPTADQKYNTTTTSTSRGLEQASNASTPVKTPEQKLAEKGIEKIHTNIIYKNPLTNETSFFTTNDSKTGKIHGLEYKIYKSVNKGQDSLMILYNGKGEPEVMTGKIEELNEQEGEGKAAKIVRTENCFVTNDKVIMLFDATTDNPNILNGVLWAHEKNPNKKVVFYHPEHNGEITERDGAILIELLKEKFGALRSVKK